MLARNPSNKNVDTTLLTRNVREEFEIRVYIKNKEEIKRIITATTCNIIGQTQEIDTETILLAHKNIIAIKRRSGLVIFRVRTKKSKKTLKKNNFWTKEILSNASLRGTSYGVVIYEVRVEKISKNIKKDGTKILTKTNKCIYPGITINKIEWLIKNSYKKKYALLIARVVSAKIANRLINKNIYSTRTKVFAKTRKFASRIQIPPQTTYFLQLPHHDPQSIRSNFFKSRS